MNKCQVCKEYIFSSSHTCLPLWEVCDPGIDLDHWVEVRAADEEDAAAEFCEREDVSSADYIYAKNGGADRILVRSPGESTYVEVCVTVETSPTYSGRRP